MTYWLAAFFVLHYDQHLIQSLGGICPVYHVAPAPAHPLLSDGHIVDGRVIYEGTIW